MATTDTPAMLVGNIGTDVEIRFLPNSDREVLDFRVASTPRVWSQGEQKWVDGDPMWTTVRMFGKLAVHVAESVKCGDRIVVSGKWQYAEWDKGDGSRRSMHYVEAYDVGVSLKFGPITGSGPELNQPDTGRIDDSDPPF